MDIAIWGTGFYAGKQSVLLKDRVTMYLDSNKKSTYFLGKKVYHPEEIKDWKDIKVYVPFNYYNEISQYLMSKGLKENVDFIKYLNHFAITKKTIENDFKRAMFEIQNNKERLKGKYIFWGHVWNGRKGYKELFQNVMVNDKSFELVLFSEEIWKTQESVEAEAGIPSIVVPILFDSDFYMEKDNYSQENDCGKLEDRIIWYNYEFASQADSETMVKMIQEFCAFVLDELKPKGIIMLGSFQNSHKILIAESSLRGIKTMFVHEGVIPGTLSIDYLGEMGRSLPAIFSKEFSKLPVTKEEINNAKEVAEYINKTGLNRKIQANLDKQLIWDRIDKKRPIVFFAGQIDTLSDMVPYNDETQKYISPIFKSTIEAAIFLQDICKRNNWNYIFKPHPSYIKKEDVELLSEDTIYVEMGNINELVDIADLTITIVSQTCYVAALRNKPVLMLGYNQISHKECVYETDKKEDIENQIKCALSCGFSDNQKEKFFLHLAQLLKYYLYDDNKDRELRYGKPMPKSFEELLELKTLLGL